MHTTNYWKCITILMPFLWTIINCESILPLHHNCGGTFLLKEDSIFLKYKSSDVVSKIEQNCNLIVKIPSGFELLGNFDKIDLNSNSKVS